MRVWPWFAASALWLCLVAWWTAFGSFGVAVTAKHFKPETVFAVASALLNLLLFGWVIPLCFGLWRLTQRLTHHGW